MSKNLDDKARKILEHLKPMQEMEDGGSFPCPRCGQHNMAINMLQNVLSHSADVYICTDCGLQEIFQKAALPLKDWSLPKSLRA